jgi:YggT family protein
MVSMLITVVLYFFDLFVLAMNAFIVGRIIVSWVAPESNIHQVLHDLTEPLLGPIRQVLPKLSMVDISPIVTLFLLDLLQYFVHSLIFKLL